MTIYTKPRAELFAQDAPPSEIKPFAAWLRGLGIAFDETNGYPELESFNGLLQALNSYIKYLEQNGFAEWSNTLEYPIGAGVRIGAVWYRAKVQNLNKPPATSQTQWAVFLNANDLSVSDPLVLSNNRISVKDATTTQKGVVRMATSAEVANRSNVSAFVKPSDIPVASTTAQGIARFATASEVSNRTNVNAAITPANVGQTFGQSLSENGWCRLPNGLIMQWGRAEISTNGTLFNFPIAFPAACLNLTIGSGEDASSQAEVMNLSPGSLTKTGFRANATAASTYRYFAIGY